MPDHSNPNRARDHLANERTFLAWVRTGVATIVFGFAVGRFSIALREFMKMRGYNSTTPGLTTWLGIISTVGGVLLILAGLKRYRKTRVQLDSNTFEPAGFVIDLVSYLLGLFGFVLAGFSPTSRYITSDRPSSDGQRRSGEVFEQMGRRLRCNHGE